MKLICMQNFRKRSYKIGKIRKSKSHYDIARESFNYFNYKTVQIMLYILDENWPHPTAQRPARMKSGRVGSPRIGSEPQFSLLQASRNETGTPFIFRNVDCISGVVRKSAVFASLTLFLKEASVRGNSYFSFVH